MPFEKLKYHCLLHFSRDSSGLSNFRAIRQYLQPLVGNPFASFIDMEMFVASVSILFA